jgi:hypothetical protein
VIGELDVARVIREDVIPLTTAYVLFLVAMARHMRRGPVPSPPRVPAAARGGLGPLARYLVVTATGGYLVFLAILLVFYVLLGAASTRFAVKGAVRGAGLAAMVVILFLLFAAAYRAVEARRQRRAEPTDG